MRKNGLMVLLLAVLIPSVAFADTTKEIEQQLRLKMPNLQVDSVSHTDMDGIYEVVTGNNIFYYHPKTEKFIFGEILDNQGQSITGQRRMDILKKNIKDIEKHVSKAVQIGRGEKVVVEFTDPNCPFCRKGYEYLHSRGDITAMVFFLAINPQSDSLNKAKYVLCAKDREKAYREVMTGKLDNKRYELCNDKSIDDILRSHMELAMRLNIGSAPTYIIGDEVVVGANIPRIEQLIGLPKGSSGDESALRRDRNHGESIGTSKNKTKERR